MNATRAWSFPELKEPEKKSAWAETPVSTGTTDDSLLRDTEREKALLRTKIIRESMSPEGALGLPPLLEKARLQWGIPDGAFRTQALFDRVHIFQIDIFEEQETYGGGVILKPSLKRLKDTEEAHRGIVLSMGMLAMDHCYSNGVELGHVVGFLKNAPFRHLCARLPEPVGDMYYLVMRDGDLTSSETLREEFRRFDKRLINVSDEGYCWQLEGNSKQKVQVSDNW